MDGSPASPLTTAPATRDVRLEQLGQSDWAAAATGPWADADALWTHLTTTTNIVRAADAFSWDDVLRPGATVVDLGCGSGWISARLSCRPGVSRVIAWDSSAAMLDRVLPRMLELADGEAAKVERVCGSFTPLLLDADSVDTVVMSSAFHHCPEPETLLDDIRRVLRPGGALVLLNETPWHPAAYAAFTARIALASAGSAFGLRPRFRGRISESDLEYDVRLGDRARTLRGWRMLAEAHGWRFEARDSGLFSYASHFRAPSRFESHLTHFVLRDGRSAP